MENIHQDKMIINKYKDSLWIHICLAFYFILTSLGNGHGDCVLYILTKYFIGLVQGRPIKMRAPILYLANRWMNSKMLLTPNRF